MQLIGISFEHYSPLMLYNIALFLLNPKPKFCHMEIANTHLNYILSHYLSYAYLDAVMHLFMEPLNNILAVLLLVTQLYVELVSVLKASYI